MRKKLSMMIGAAGLAVALAAGPVSAMELQRDAFEPAFQIDSKGMVSIPYQNYFNPKTGKSFASGIAAPTAYLNLKQFNDPKNYHFSTNIQGARMGNDPEHRSNGIFHQKFLTGDKNETLIKGKDGGAGYFRWLIRDGVLFADGSTADFIMTEKNIRIIVRAVDSRTDNTVADTLKKNGDQYYGIQTSAVQGEMDYGVAGIESGSQHRDMYGNEDPDLHKLGYFKDSEFTFEISKDGKPVENQVMTLAALDLDVPGAKKSDPHNLQVSFENGDTDPDEWFYPESLTLNEDAVVSKFYIPKNNYLTFRAKNGSIYTGPGVPTDPSHHPSKSVYRNDNSTYTTGYQVNVIPDRLTVHWRGTECGSQIAFLGVSGQNREEQLNHSIIGITEGKYPENGVISAVFRGKSYSTDNAEHKSILLLPDGNDVTYQVTPDEGNAVRKLTVDGTKIGLADAETKLPGCRVVRDGNGYSLIFEKTGANHEIRAEFVPVQKAVIRYIDQKTGEEIAKDTAEGPSEEPIGYRTKSRIDGFEQKGYHLVKDGYPEDAVFDDDVSSDQIYKVILDHRFEDAEPEQHTVTRKIHYIYEDGTKASEDVTQNAVWERSVKKDLTDGSRIFGDWHSAQPVLPAVESPEIENHTVSREKVEASVTKSDTPDLDITVMYAKKPDQKGSVRIVTEDKRILAQTSFAGPEKTSFAEAGDEVGVKRLKDLTDSGYEVVDNPYLNAEKVYDTDPKTDQDFTITVRPIIELIPPDEPREEGDIMNPNGDPYPDGLKEADLNESVTRTIHYVYEAEPEKKAAEDRSETLVFTRAAKVNHVTGEVRYEDWKSGNDSFRKEISPALKGYSPDRAAVDQKKVKAEAEDLTETVAYRKDMQKVIVHYQDDNGNPLTADVVLTGESGGQVEYSTRDVIESFENLGYRLARDEFPKDARYDEDKEHDQEYTVRMVRVPEAEPDTEMPEADSNSAGREEAEPVKSGWGETEKEPEKAPAAEPETAAVSHADGVKTGDQTPVRAVFWTGILAAGVLGTVLVLKKRKG